MRARTVLLVFVLGAIAVFAAGFEGVRVELTILFRKPTDLNNLLLLG